MKVKKLILLLLNLLVLAKHSNAQDFQYLHASFVNDSVSNVWKASFPTPPPATLTNSCIVKVDSFKQTFSVNEILNPQDLELDIEKANIKCEFDDLVVFSGHIRNSKLQGNFHIFYPSGHILMKAIFDGGHIAENVTSYYDTKTGHAHRMSNETGQIRSIIEYSENRIDKVVKMYTESGKKLNPGTLKNGSGIVNVYSGSGVLMKTIEFQNGVQHGQSKYFDSDGRLIMKGEVNNNLMNGIWKEYDSLGNTVQITHYEHGRLIKAERE